MCTVNKEVCEIRSARVEKHDESIEQLKECVTRLTTLAELQAQSIEEMNRRLNIIEKQPRDHLKTIIAATISAVIGAAVTLIFSIGG